MLWWLVMLLAIAFCCSSLAPDSGLHKSALQAFDSSVGVLSRAGVEQSATSRRERAESVDYEPDAEGTPQLRSVLPALRTSPPLRTSNIRKRVTPHMLKRVAVRYNFRCALCHLPLDETWETDHRIPLSQARNAAEAERLNSIDNLQPVHRACHQMKWSREAASTTKMFNGR